LSTDACVTDTEVNLWVNMYLFKHPIWRLNQLYNVSTKFAVMPFSHFAAVLTVVHVLLCTVVYGMKNSKCNEDNYRKFCGNCCEH